MEGVDVSIDALEQQIIADELLIARLRARQVAALAVLDRAQVVMADGCRSLAEWTAARLDVAPETAKRLVGVMRRLGERPDLGEALAAGEATFDRVEAVSRISDGVGLREELDVAGVRREAARRRGVAADAEFRTATDRFLVMQPSLDESWWRLWGGLDGPSGALVDKVLAEAADRLPDLPDGDGGGASWRRATALVELCVNDDPPPAQVTVFVDAADAVSSEGGVVLEAGPAVGRRALEAVLCESVTEVVARTADGRFMEYGRRTRTVPPALRRAILHRDGGVCAADGCQSRHRLQIHHLRPWSQGGRTDPDNLITLCWFHHQVVVHQRGYTPYRHPDHGRVRFRPPGRDPP